MLTATQLVQWADTNPGRSALPLLVRRLILASVRPDHIDFPAGDSVNRPGYDGLLRATAVDSHVPSGQSVWEMGTTQDVAGKANGDYTTRSTGPATVVRGETTFVFVTPRRWQGKTQWVAARRAAGVWADVRCLDADDLEQWLERCPAVAAWARDAVAGVGAVDGLQTLEEFWTARATRTNPPLTASLFTGGRSDAVARVREWIEQPASSLRIRAASADEAALFLAAVAETSADLRDAVYSRTVLASTPAAWRSVAGGHTPCIVVTTSPAVALDLNAAVGRGHRVALLYGQESAGVQVDIDLPLLRRQDVDTALREMGVPDNQRQRLAGESQGRVSVLVELLNGAVVPPQWAASENAAQLVPFLLAGAWAGTDADMDVVARLGGVSRDEVSRRLARWTNVPDAPVRSVAGAWEWVSRERAWPHLAPYLIAADLATFSAVAVDVLGETDPALELEPEQRWAAAIHNRSRRYSGQLRGGFAETLAILAGRPEPTLAARQPADVAARVVHTLFDPATDPARWYSLAQVLPLLAEAAPGVFLTAVEKGPVADAVVRQCLFQEEGPFHNGHHHHLLWALETLAWSAQYLTRAVLALGALAANDPGGRVSNRPATSLRGILLAWRRYTTANITQRLAVIDTLCRRHPDVAFDLCTALLPSYAEVATSTHTPRHRPWADGDGGVTVAEYEDYTRQVFDRLLNWAGGEQARWVALLSPIRCPTAVQLDRLFCTLESLQLEQLAEETGDQLRCAVRKVVHQKRTIEGVYPEITAEYVARMETIYHRLTPSDPVRRDAWLFSHHPDLLSVGVGDDWRVEHDVRDRERAAVVRRFLDDGRVDDLVRLAEASEEPWTVGYLVGQSALPDGEAIRLLATHLTSDSVPWRGFASGVVWGRFRRDGWTWVEQTFASEGPRGWPDPQKAAFALALPFGAATWDWVESWSEGAGAAYWEAVHRPWTEEPRDVERAIRTLLDRSRPQAAFHLVVLSTARSEGEAGIAPGLMLEALQALTAVMTGELVTTEPIVARQGMGYDVGRVLDAVAGAGVADDTELLRIECVWQPVLCHDPRGTPVIHRTLQREPAFFVDLIRFRFRPRFPGREDEPVPALDDRGRQRAEQAYRVLHDWTTVPGVRDDGTVDADALRDWVTRARGMLCESGHVVIGDQEIGQVLAYLPHGSDGVWPHECLRELLEDLGSEDVELGVHLGVVNAGNGTVRECDAGGEQERTRAARYDDWADALIAWPRAAEVVRGLAETYRRYARMEDHSRDRREFMH